MFFLFETEDWVFFLHFQSPHFMPGGALLFRGSHHQIHIVYSLKAVTMIMYVALSISCGKRNIRKLANISYNALIILQRFMIKCCWFNLKFCVKHVCPPIVSVSFLVWETKRTNYVLSFYSIFVNEKSLLCWVFMGLVDFILTCKI